MPRSMHEKWELVNVYSKSSYTTQHTGILVTPGPLYRLKVPGGWFVTTCSQNSGSSRAMLFYPDPEYKWDPPFEESH